MKTNLYFKQRLIGLNFYTRTVKTAKHFKCKFIAERIVKKLRKSGNEATLIMLNNLQGE